jgi:hypothetical protein
MIHTWYLPFARRARPRRLTPVAGSPTNVRDAPTKLERVAARRSRIAVDSDRPGNGTDLQARTAGKVADLPLREASDSSASALPSSVGGTGLEPVAPDRDRDGQTRPTRSVPAWLGRFRAVSTGQDWTRQTDAIPGRMDEPWMDRHVPFGHLAARRQLRSQ